MTAHDPRLSGPMPPLAPLAMPTQDLSRPFADPQAPATADLKNTGLFRWATLLPAVATTCILIVIMMDWFGKDGFVATEIIMLLLVTFSAFWIALSVAASTIGLLFSRRFKPAPGSDPTHSLDVALLVPIYNENVDEVFSRILAMREDIASTTSNHRFALFILSDTRDDTIAANEKRLFQTAKLRNGNGVPLYYRRRDNNSERKTGNIRQWVENWGASWPAFITLDADSLMSAKTITRLADELAHTPDAGLLQTVPQLMGASSFFARVQQFANNVYGSVLAHGLDRWSGHDGNYWGHNAIIRTKAFAACAGLPKLQGNGALGGTIKSHDFVEAALLRRAGWSVRLMPHLGESYEETPQTIVDYVLRDRRWCQGNLQHLRIMFSSGFTPISRFHMLQGAMAYVASFVWFFLLIAWALMGRGEEDNVFRYFTDTNPLFPQWPEMDAVNRLVVLVFMFGLLLMPKILGLIQVAIQTPDLAKFGGAGRFVSSALLEIGASFMFAPILMIQHVIAVSRTFLNLDAGWAPQNRGQGQYSWLMLARFHWLETVIGSFLFAGITMGVVSLWLAPIALSLCSAIPLSFWSGKTLPLKNKFTRVLGTGESLQPSRIIQTASQSRISLQQV